MSTILIVNYSMEGLAFQYFVVVDGSDFCALIIVNHSRQFYTKALFGGTIVVDPGLAQDLPLVLNSRDFQF